MTKTKERGQPEYNRNYDIGDLVSVYGEDGKVFRVEGYKEVHEVNDGEAPLGYTEYFISDTDDNDAWWDVAYDEDMTLLAKAENSTKYLRNRQARGKRARKGGRQPLTVDDLLSDLHTFIEIRRELKPGPMFDVMGEMIRTVKKALEKKTAGGDR